MGRKYSERTFRVEELKASSQEERENRMQTFAETSVLECGNMAGRAWGVLEWDRGQVLVLLKQESIANIS